MSRDPRDLVRETNPLPSQYHEKVTYTIVDQVDWADKRLKRIVRLRLLTDQGFPAYDVSYCHGQLHDGTYVDVVLPFGQLPKRGMRKAIVAYAKRDGVFAHGIGLFGAISVLS